MKARLQEVAEVANVSASTVSRALNTPDLVSPDTRDRVIEAARSLDYRPSRAARAVATGRTRNIGLIVPDIANPFFPSLVKSAQARARATDYSTFLGDSDEDGFTELELIKAMAEQVDGVVVCSSRMSDAQVEQIMGLTRLVFLNRAVDGVPAVLVDSADGLRQAISHLHALGHTDLAFLGGPTSSWSNRDRLDGVRRASEALGLNVPVLGPYAPRFEAGKRAADEAVAAGVTAILAFNDLMALGVLARLAQRGIDVPGDVSVVGFDDIPMAAISSPPLTTVSISSADAGRHAVDMLVRALGEPGPSEPDRVLVETHLIIRASTGPRPREGGEEA